MQRLTHHALAFLALALGSLATAQAQPAQAIGGRRGERRDPLPRRRLASAHRNLQPDDPGRASVRLSVTRISVLWSGLSGEGASLARVAHRSMVRRLGRRTACRIE